MKAGKQRLWSGGILQELFHFQCPSCCNSWAKVDGTPFDSGMQVHGLSSDIHPRTLGHDLGGQVLHHASNGLTSWIGSSCHVVTCACNLLSSWSIVHVSSKRVSETHMAFFFVRNADSKADMLTIRAIYYEPRPVGWLSKSWHCREEIFFLCLMLEGA